VTRWNEPRKNISAIGAGAGFDTGSFPRQLTVIAVKNEFGEWEGSGMSDNLETARRYLKAIESGQMEELAGLFDPEVIVEIFPSKFFPQGSRSNLAAIRAAAERGRKVMTSQTYEVKNAVVSGDQVALEIAWTGTLAVPFEAIPAGGQMRARFASFLQFRNGKILSQRNYDCYEA
jgi:ketosteroid isomerase-like protein